MKRPISLTLRLNLFFGIAALIVFSGFGWFIERSINQHFSSGDAAELEVIANAVTNAIKQNKNINHNQEQLKQRFHDFLVGHHRAILQLTDENASVLFKSSNKINFSDFFKHYANNDNGSILQWTSGIHTYRILVQNIKPTPSNTYTIAVAMPIDYHIQFLHNFRYALWSMIASGILVMSVMGLLAIKQGHAPLHNIISQIRRIHSNELSSRLDSGAVPHELKHLAISFNEMMERMELDFQRLSNFSADIAHELRTPVTSLLTQTQVALAQTRDNNEYQEILYSNIEEYERMAQMISDMLFLAQTENGLYEPQSVEIDLAKEVTDLFEYYEAWAEENGITLKLTGEANAMGDRLMLRRVIGNLLSNAIKHTPRNNEVIIKLSYNAQNESIICVENHGSEIPDEHVTKIFDRFYRVDASRQRSGDSTGLGLAIAKSIVEIHGGDISATSKNGITQFFVCIPKSK